MSSRKFWSSLGIILLLLILFRETIFRLVVNYAEVGDRKVVKITNVDLLAEIKKDKRESHLSMEEIKDLSLDITTEFLQFSTTATSQNPNDTFKSGKANCVGYAAMFNAIANYLIIEQQEENRYIVTHLIGKLDVFGTDLHQFFDSPFFKDHDFNKIYDSTTKETIFIDASISDYFWINRVASTE